MTLTSLSFFAFVGAMVAIYYVVPKKFQAYVLLGISILFYMLVSTPWTIIYMIITSVSTYCATLYMDKNRDGSIKAVYLGTLVLNMGILAVLKYSNFALSNVMMFCRLFHIENNIHLLDLAASLGISYYTLQMLGYLTDVYWNVQTPQRNFAKLALFNCYFPQLSSGPISRYSDLGPQFDLDHRFDFGRVSMGAERVLWGVFKKLVISERMATVVNGIYSNPATYNGAYIWAAMLLFPIQIYCDFSGCMDIVLGVSECFDIKLAENFRTPFFSRSVQEFWQRWHITLGLFLRNYVMYPLLKTKTWTNMGRKLKKKYGKKCGKMVPTFIAMLILWFCNGIWHGNSWKYIVGVGLWFWLTIVVGQLIEPFSLKLVKILHINQDTKAWHFFQSFRTYVLYGIGALFFCATDLRNGVFLVKCGFTNFHIDRAFFEGFMTFGLDIYDFILTFVCIIILYISSCVTEKYGSIRNIVRSWNGVARFAFWFCLLIVVLIFGKYGSGYDASAFIYAQF